MSRLIRAPPSGFQHLQRKGRRSVSIQLVSMVYAKETKSIYIYKYIDTHFGFDPGTGNMPLSISQLVLSSLMSHTMATSKSNRLSPTVVESGL